MRDETIPQARFVCSLLMRDQRNCNLEMQLSIDIIVEGEVELEVRVDVEVWPGGSASNRIPARACPVAVKSCPSRQTANLMANAMFLGSIDCLINEDSNKEMWSELKIFEDLF